jgi:hypothetical protein
MKEVKESHTGSRVRINGKCEGKYVMQDAVQAQSLG